MKRDYQTKCLDFKSLVRSLGLTGPDATLMSQLDELLRQGRCTALEGKLCTFLGIIMFKDCPVAEKSSAKERMKDELLSATNVDWDDVEPVLLKTAKQHAGLKEVLLGKKAKKESTSG